MNHEATRTEPIVSPTVRSSNLELFRILLMLMIIAHHYVVNSEIADFFNPTHPTANMLFMTLYGWGGKTGINCFVLITGYFMCQKSFSWQKFFKLAFEVQFYTTVIYLLFLLSGRSFSWGELYQMLLAIPLGVGQSFVGSFLCLYLLIPFVNKLIHSMNEREFRYLLVLLVGIYSVIGTFIPFGFYENIAWFVVIYLIGSYIRLHGMPIFSKHSFLFMATSLITAMASILLLFYFFKYRGINTSIWDTYYFVSNSNKIMALLCSVSMFLFFKDLKMKNNRWINKIATATFGVLLIHGNSDAMREWLWDDVLKNASFYNSSYMWLHALLSVLLVYLVCVAIDLLRIRFVEKPIFKAFDSRKSSRWGNE